jgi:tricorn protease-like protein
MRKVLLRFVLPVGVLLTVGVVGFYALRSPGPTSDWTRSLRKAASGADRLVVHDMDFFGKGPQPDCEIRGAGKVREMLDSIDIDASGSGFHCMCDGQYWIHLYKGDREILTLGYHHGRSLRWHKGSWKGDGLLTAASCEALPAWFKKNGCPYLQSLCDEERARQRQEADEATRFASFFPEKVRGLLLERGGTIPLNGNDDPVGRKIAEVMADGAATATAVCRALGSSSMSWGVTGEKERRALTAVHTVSGEEFLSALDRLRDDRQGLRGAARVFFGEEFHKKVSGKVRTEWAVRLAEIVLTDGLDGDKPTLLRFLEEEQGPEVDSLLRDVFRGKTGKEIDRVRAFGEEPGLRAGAALALVLRGDKSVKSEIERMLPRARAKPDVAALEVCLALLGDPSYVKTEHFRLGSYSIGLAGLKAIERFQGKHGMEALVKGGIRHPWAYVRDEALLTFERITGRKMSAGEIEDWWEVEHEGKRRPKPVLELAGNTDQLRCVTFSHDGAFIASGSNDSTAKVWNADTGEKIRTLRGHKSTVTDVAFRSDDRQLATSSIDGTVKTWDLKTGTEIRTFRGHTQWVEHVAFSPDGKRLVSAGRDGVRVWNAVSGKPLLAFAAEEGGAECLAIRPDGQRIALGSRKGKVQIWDPVKGTVDRELEGLACGAASIAYDADGKLLAGGGKDGTVRLWDADKGALIRTMTGHKEWVAGVAFSPDGKLIASAAWDKTVKIWDLATGRAIVSFKAHPESINGIAYRFGGKRIATASEDKTIRVWDVGNILDSAKAWARD